jgi:hypothetical protein
MSSSLISKRIIRLGYLRSVEGDFDAAVQTETFGLDYLLKTQDHKEAEAAFLEKRPAKFQGK